VDPSVDPMEVCTRGCRGILTAGYYFVLNNSNAIKKTRLRMMKTLRNSSNRREMTENSGDDLSFNPIIAKSYKEGDVRLRRISLILLSLTRGLNCR
jgi:hypothetical protein